MQSLILARYHAELMHVGAEKFWLTVRQEYIGGSLYTDIKDYVAQCTVCKQGKAETHPLRPSLQSRQLPEEIFNTLHIDHVKVPKRTKDQKFGYILVLLDALSLNCELVPTVGTLKPRRWCRCWPSHFGWHRKGYLVIWHILPQGSTEMCQGIESPLAVWLIGRRWTRLGSDFRYRYLRSVFSAPHMPFCMH